MPRHATSTSFKPGIDPKTGKVATYDYSEWSKRYYERHKPRMLQRNWERQIRALGCTPELYDKLMAEQDGKCAICRGVNTSHRPKRLAVDHCHSTGVVRGLLCNRCNRTLGAVNDRPDLLRRMADYCAIRSRPQ